MGDVLFYHMTSTPLAHCLPDILEKSLARGWRALVRAGDVVHHHRLDQLLWNYTADSFLPHGVAGAGYEADQPILLGEQAENGAQLLCLVEGARLALDEIAAFERVCLFFDAGEEAQMQAARADWKLLSDAGQKAVYWAQQNGKWVKQAENG